MLEKPAFLQGIFSFTGARLAEPAALQPPLSYVVPADKTNTDYLFQSGKFLAGASLRSAAKRRQADALFPYRRKECRACATGSC